MLNRLRHLDNRVVGRLEAWESGSPAREQPEENAHGQRRAGLGGRASVTDWLLTVVLVNVFNTALLFLTVATGSGLLLVLAVLVLLVTTVALFRVTVRRLHDTGRSGTTVLLALIPFVGQLVVLVLCLMPSVNGPNRWGPQPTGRASEPTRLSRR